MNELKLFMVELGCKPKGCLKEQHDIRFFVGESFEGIIPQIKNSWTEFEELELVPDTGAKKIAEEHAPKEVVCSRIPVKLHVDVWREVTRIKRHLIQILPKDEGRTADENGKKLFYVNLGGYTPGKFNEDHLQILVVANDIAEAKTIAVKNVFFEERKNMTDTPGASHVDDKFEVDDCVNIAEQIPGYEIMIQKTSPAGLEQGDQIHIGYLPIK